MSDALLSVVIPAVCSLIAGIIGIWIGYRKMAAGAELDEATAAQIIKKAAMGLITPLTEQIASQGTRLEVQNERILAMDVEFRELEKGRAQREKRYMEIFDKLRSRIDNLEAIIAVQGELLFILRGGADELIGQLVGIGIEPLFTLDHDKVVELEAALSEVCGDGHISGCSHVQQT